MVSVFCLCFPLGMDMERFFDKLQITDASKVFLLNGKTVGKVEGDPSNIKITNPTDIEFANILIGRQKALKREYKNNNEEE